MTDETHDIADEREMIRQGQITVNIAKELNTEPNPAADRLKYALIEAGADPLDVYNMMDALITVLKPEIRSGRGRLLDGLDDRPVLVYSYFSEDPLYDRVEVSHLPWREVETNNNEGNNHE